MSYGDIGENCLNDVICEWRDLHGCKLMYVYKSVVSDLHNLGVTEE